MLYSLYPEALRQDLPCGVGILYEGANGIFKMKSMQNSGKQSSLSAIEWLEYQSGDNEWGVDIKHALNFGEEKVAGYYVDGYAILPDVTPYKIVFEFLGCRFHR
jgi:hypothetical protein